MSDTNFLAQLVEAQKALEALPQAQQELYAARDQLNYSRQANDVLRATNDGLGQTIESLNATLSAKEAALSDATFREQQLRDQLAMFTTLLKGVVGEANAAIELVEPKPEPVIEPVVTIEATTSEPTPSDPTSSSDLGSIDASPSNEQSATDLPGIFPWSEAPVEPYKPYADQPYRMKPSYMTWTEWMSNGGIQPPWVDSDGFDHHDIISAENGKRAS